MVTSSNIDPEGVPNSSSLGAGSEDVIICLQSFATNRTEGFVQSLDVPLEQVSPRVGPVEVQQPAEELEFPREPAVPDECWVRKDWVLGMESEVGTSAREGG